MNKHNNPKFDSLIRFEVEPNWGGVISIMKVYGFTINRVVWRYENFTSTPFTLRSTMYEGTS